MDRQEDNNEKVAIRPGPSPHSASRSYPGVGSSPSNVERGGRKETTEVSTARLGHQDGRVAATAMAATAMAATVMTTTVIPAAVAPVAVVPVAAIPVAARPPDGMVEVRQAAAVGGGGFATPSDEPPSEGHGLRRPWHAVITTTHPRSLLYPLSLAIVAVVMTGWWIAGLVLHRHDLGWVVPSLVWLAITLRILTLHPPTKRIVGLPLWAVKVTLARWSEVGHYEAPAVLQRHVHFPLAAATTGIILLGTYVPTSANNNSRADRTVSLLGLVVFLGAFYATSRNRIHINCRAVLGGTATQFLLGLFVLKTKAGYDIFDFIGRMAKTLLRYSADGTVFLTSHSAQSTGWFLISVVPAVIFFVSFVHLLQYWGWISWVVGHFATAFTYPLGISGAEAVVAAASPFIGQGESAVLIREYMPRLTQAEIHQIMTSGFATIAGSLMSVYMQMGISPVAIVSSCVMSIPASIVLSKLRYPETEVPVTRGQAPLRGGENHEHRQEQAGMEEGRAQQQQQQEQEADVEPPYNALHAVGRGSWLGLKIAGMIVASVLCIVALLGLADGLLGWWGSYINVPQLRIQLIMGYLLYPVAFLLGVDRSNDGGGDLRKVAELLGIKIVANEFVAYGDFTTDPQYKTLSPRSQIIVMYALCGFGNFGSLGIQVGALTQLSPRRTRDVASVALSALITGITATLTSATIVGMLMSGDALLPQAKIQ